MMIQEAEMAAHSSCGNCIACGGGRWGLIREVTEFYGADTVLDFGVLCKYAGERRNKDITGIPAMYYDVDYSKFKFEAYSVDMMKIQKITDNFISKYETWQLHGKGLYLWSRTPGSGKTFLTCCLAKSLMTKWDFQMWFITAPAYIVSVAESYKRERENITVLIKGLGSAGAQTACSHTFTAPDCMNGV